VSQAATVPPGSHSGIVVERNNTNGNFTDYHTFAHTSVAVNDPTTNMIRF
jgi:hypothetical protein